MPVYDYRCTPCSRSEFDVVVMPGEDPERACPSCGEPMLRPPAAFALRMAGPSMQRSVANEGAMWGAEHRARLQTGDPAAVREVHYDVARRSGVSAERSREIVADSVPQGIRMGEEQARVREREQPLSASIAMGKADG